MACADQCAHLRTSAQPVFLGMALLRDQRFSDGTFSQLIKEPNLIASSLVEIVAVDLLDAVCVLFGDTNTVIDHELSDASEMFKCGELRRSFNKTR
jgi:hypothetical protein